MGFVWSTPRRLTEAQHNALMRTYQQKLAKVQELAQQAQQQQAAIIEDGLRDGIRDGSLTLYNGLSYAARSNPVFVPSKPTKILVSPGLGTGWITCAPRTATDAFLVWMLTYEPLIRAIEVKGREDKLEEILRQFHKEAHNKYQVDGLVVAKVQSLEVHEVNFPFEVREVGGQERIVDVTGRRSIDM